MPYVAAVPPALVLGTLTYIERLEAEVIQATARAATLEAEAAGLRERAGEQRYGYTPTESELPALGKPVLLQPNHEWALPEFGRCELDEVGHYWRVNGQRSTRYALENWKGWAYLPTAPPAPVAAAPPREPQGQEGGPQDV